MCNLKQEQVFTLGYLHFSHEFPRYVTENYCYSITFHRIQTAYFIDLASFPWCLVLDLSKGAPLITSALATTIFLAMIVKHRKEQSERCVLNHVNYCE